MRTPRYYGQSALSPRKESPYIFSKFNPINKGSPLTRTLSIPPSVSVLKRFVCIIVESTYMSLWFRKTQWLNSLSLFSVFLLYILTLWRDHCFTHLLFILFITCHQAFSTSAPLTAYFLPGLSLLRTWQDRHIATSLLMVLHPRCFMVTEYHFYTQCHLTCTS